jgi:hypothetical protein
VFNCELPGAVQRRLNKVNPQEVANAAWAFAKVISYSIISAHTLDLLTHGRGRR